jgi:hypothetical protein
MLKLRVCTPSQTVYMTSCGVIGGCTQTLKLVKLYMTDNSINNEEHEGQYVVGAALYLFLELPSQEQPCPLQNHE